MFLVLLECSIKKKTLQNCEKQGSANFLLCPNQGPKIEGVVLHRVCILGFFVPNWVRVRAPLHPTMGQVPPPPPRPQPKENGFYITSSKLLNFPPLLNKCNISDLSLSLSDVGVSDPPPLPLGVLGQHSVLESCYQDFICKNQLIMI